ncbi:unnamed protein product [Ascophyllum nodosum]
MFRVECSPWWKKRCLSFVAAALALTVVAAPGHAMQQDDQAPADSTGTQHTSSAATQPRVRSLIPGEELTIQPNTTPLLQRGGKWGNPGNFVWMGSTGEPKSGTTWTETIITDLAVHLCGSSRNTWCQMGGLTERHGVPAPKYEWEMLYADTGELFMHFTGNTKHTILGLDVGEDCNPRGNYHPNGFMTGPPCKNGPVMPTRESILQCLPDTSERCSDMMPSRDPAVLRMAVVFRDPRDIVISERRMRIEVYHERNISELIPFIYRRFETLVSWQFVRWVWHTTFYKDVSHVMFYEDIKTNPENLMDLANFMGLNASLEQVQEVQEAHETGSSHGSFETYGIPRETIEYMNETMIRLLPQEMLARYGLS